MFACSLQLTVCVRASVFKEIAAVKNSLCQIGGTLCGMYDIVLREKHCFNNAKTRTFFTSMFLDTGGKYNWVCVPVQYNPNLRLHVWKAIWKYSQWEAIWKYSQSQWEERLVHVFPLFPTAADPSLLFPARGFAERGLTPAFSVHNYQIINNTPLCQRFQRWHRISNLLKHLNFHKNVI